MNPRSFAAVAAEHIGDDNKQWIEVLPTCTEAKNGPWLMTITAGDLEAYAESIRRNGDKIPVDYDHEGATGGSTKAAGWLTGAARVTTTDRGPILEAEVQWTPDGAAAVRNGDFRMISSEFNFHDRDKKSGLLTKAKEFIAATLTNRPYFRQLAPVASQLDDLQVAALAADLEVPAEEFARFLTTHGGRAASRKEHQVDASVLAKSLGLPEDATEEQITEAVTAAQAAQTELETVKAENAELKASAGDNDRIAKLESELANEKKLRLDGELESTLATAVTERKIDPAQKAVLAEQYADNPAGLKTLLATFTSKPAGERGSGGEARTDGKPDLKPIVVQGSEIPVDEDSAKVHAKAMKILEDKGKTDPTASEYVSACEQATRELAAA